MTAEMPGLNVKDCIWVFLKGEIRLESLKGLEGG